ncbi:hypothetical protein PoB_001625300 [Plakobranchus ocellatus]|uniref:Uncharacterized protein n=1 Tax=Plakobranchus ocellatus TaxID=259542 RepID=A0AAV3Z4U8_9GAST|nr:hypothetical protein PoB_001625300 [Plakobranchus ocellatus]
MTLRQLSRLLVFVIFFIAFAVPQTKEGTCKAMRKCNKKIWHGRFGIFSFQNLKSYPTKRADWTKFYKGICRKQKATLRCTNQNNECKKQSYKRNFKVAKLMFLELCNKRGLKYFKRIYWEEKQCLGNATNMAALRRETKKCEAEGYDLVREKKRGRFCRSLKRSWDCDLASVEKLCSLLSKWMRYRYWKAVVLSGYKICWWRLLKKEQVAFPTKAVNCKNVENCINDILMEPNGLFAFRNRTPFIENERMWWSYLEEKCREINETLKCVGQPTECRDRTVGWDLHVAIQLMKHLCTPPQLRTYEHLSEMDKYCPDNRTAASFLLEKDKECYAPLKSAVPRTICRLLNSTRYCELETVAKQCNVSAGEYAHRYWRAKILHEDLDCNNRIERNEARRPPKLKENIYEMASGVRFFFFLRIFQMQAGRSFFKKVTNNSTTKHNNNNYKDNNINNHKNKNKNNNDNNRTITNKN